MTVTLPDDPFATATQASASLDRSKVFGQTYNGRYHMPLLPGETGTKACPEWVPRGLMRASNLASAFSESRALSIWEQELGLVGMALRPDLYEELVILIHRAMRDGVDFLKIRDHPKLREALTGSPKHEADSIMGRAKEAAGATKARQAGNNRHTAWEVRAPRVTSADDPTPVPGDLIGTPAMRSEIETLEALLERYRLRRVPDMSERTVRNTVLNCSGRFDDVLEHVPTGRLFMADLKTKQRPFWTWLEVDIQLAIYARSRHMLARPEKAGLYEPGPAALPNISFTRGIVLHMPSNSDEPALRPADLARGWVNAQRARLIVDERAYGKSAERRVLSEQLDEILQSS